MIKHVWSVLCQNSIEDKETNNITLLVFEQLTVNIPKEISQKNEKLTINNKFEIVSLWDKVENKEKMNKGDVIIELFSPEREKLFETSHSFEFGDKQRMRTRSQIIGLPLTTKGFYQFHVSLKDESAKKKKVAEIPLEVVITTESNLPKLNV